MNIESITSIEKLNELKASLLSHFPLNQTSEIILPSGKEGIFTSMEFIKPIALNKECSFKRIIKSDYLDDSIYKISHKIGQKKSLTINSKINYQRIMTWTRLNENI